MKKFVLVFCAFLLVTIIVLLVSNSALRFHKPAFHGQIIDHETRQPIEYVVVVAVYRVRNIFGGVLGPVFRDIGFKKMVTDKKGMFTIPEFTAWSKLFARPYRTRFIIYRARYSNFGIPEKIFPAAKCWHENPAYFFPECFPEALFSKEIGSKEQIVKNEDTGETLTITNGIIELVRTKSSTEINRTRAIIAPETDSQFVWKMVKEEDERYRRTFRRPWSLPAPPPESATLMLKKIPARQPAGATTKSSTEINRTRAIIAPETDSQFVSKMVKEEDERYRRTFRRPWSLPAPPPESATLMLKKIPARQPAGATIR